MSCFGGRRGVKIAAPSSFLCEGLLQGPSPIFQSFFLVWFGLVWLQHAETAQHKHKHCSQRATHKHKQQQQKKKQTDVITPSSKRYPERRAQTFRVALPPPQYVCVQKKHCKNSRAEEQDNIVRRRGVVWIGWGGSMPLRNSRVVYLCV